MLAYGRPEEAIGHLEALWALQGPFNSAIAIAVIPDLVEATVRTGRPDVARDWLGRLPVINEVSSNEARALVLRSRALLANAYDADRLFNEAVQAHALTERPLDQARTLLLHGEYLRRERRRVD